MYDEPMTQARRERFWRTYGWHPNLPQHERTAIEDRFADHEIREAEALGF